MAGKKKIMKKNLSKHWIPVSDSLPEFNVPVIGYWTYKDGDKIGHAYEFVHLESLSMTAIGTTPVFKRYSTTEVGKLVDCKPTHWMYLAPPIA